MIRLLIWALLHRGLYLKQYLLILRGATYHSEESAFMLQTMLAEFALKDMGHIRMQQKRKP